MTYTISFDDKYLHALSEGVKTSTLRRTIHYGVGDIIQTSFKGVKLEVTGLEKVVFGEITPEMAVTEGYTDEEILKADLQEYDDELEDTSLLWRVSFNTILDEEYNNETTITIRLASDLDAHLRIDSYEGTCIDDSGKAEYEITVKRDFNQYLGYLSLEGFQTTEFHFLMVDGRIFLIFVNGMVQQVSDRVIEVGLNE